MNSKTFSIESPSLTTKVPCFFPSTTFNIRTGLHSHRDYKKNLTQKKHITFQRFEDPESQIQIQENLKLLKPVEIKFPINQNKKSPKYFIKPQIKSATLIHSKLIKIRQERDFKQLKSLLDTSAQLQQYNNRSQRKNNRFKHSKQNYISKSKTSPRKKCMTTNNYTLSGLTISLGQVKKN